MIEVTTDKAGKPRGMFAAMSAMLNRSAFANMLGLAFDGKRDYYEVFGYPRTLNAELMWEMYYRGGIAHRIIHAYPDAVWARPPKVHSYADPAFDEKWAKFAKDLQVWEAIKRADILAGLGRYSIILVGTTNGNLVAPLRKDARITFLQPYAETNAAISEWETDVTNPRFGMPKYYTIYPRTARRVDFEQSTSVAPVAQSFKVHASRVIHISRGGLESTVFGVPRYAPIWNYLCDLMKVVGSSAESYWMTAYQGLHANVDPEMDMKEDDAADLSDEIDEYQHGLRRFIRTRGVEVKNLGSRVADPRGAFDVVLTLIAGTSGIPKRILLGSEAGQLASGQDRANWAERIEEERVDHAEPHIIHPMLTWLNESGMMTIPEDAQLLWPEAYRMSPLERGQQSAQTARTASNILKAVAPTLMKKGTAPTTDPITGVVTDPGGADEYGDALLTREEARAIIGLSTDQHLLQHEVTPPATATPPSKEPV